LNNPFPKNDPPQFHKSLWLVVIRNGMNGCIFHFQTIQKVKCAVGVKLARCIVNGLEH